MTRHGTAGTEFLAVLILGTAAPVWKLIEMYVIQCTDSSSYLIPSLYRECSNYFVQQGDIYPFWSFLRFFFFSFSNGNCRKRNWLIYIKVKLEMNQLSAVASEDAHLKWKRKEGRKRKCLIISMYHYAWEQIKIPCNFLVLESPN